MASGEWVNGRKGEWANERTLERSLHWQPRLHLSVSPPPPFSRSPFPRSQRATRHPQQPIQDALPVSPQPVVLVLVGHPSLDPPDGGRGFLGERTLDYMSS